MVGTSRSSGKKKKAVEKTLKIAPLPTVHVTLAEAEDYKELEADEDTEEIIACCLCRCAVDYSDKSYFCQEARDADSDLEGVQPKLLPLQLYNPHNALVFCDTCERPYHQQCHFVPVVALPRGDWHCFICTSSPKLLTPTPTKDTSRAKAQKPQHHQWTKKELDSRIFQMHPDNKVRHLEQQWEYDTRLYKVQAFRSEVQRIRKALRIQLQHVRLSQMALKSICSSRSNASSIVAKFRSQELCQTVVKLTGAKLKVRQLLLALEAYMKSESTDWHTLQTFLVQNPKERTAWFPFGCDFAKREPPRLIVGEDEETDELVVPNEIVLGKKKSPCKASTCSKNTAAKNNACTNNAKKSNNDDDSGISLDDLKCCICFIGDATDDNDVLLCDGKGCFRAHHYQCLLPAMTVEEAEAEEDWFCPLCTALAKLVAEVQSEYTGDEWYNEDDDASVQSWDDPKDVFVGAELEHAMAIKWKKNDMDAECRAFLTRMLGEDEDVAAEIMQDTEMHVVEEEDDEDDDFDPNAKAPVSEKQDDDSSSQDCSIQDMSSVELNIGRKELAALSGGEEDSSDDENDEEHKPDSKPRRRSRRFRSARSSRNNTDTEESHDSVDATGGGLDMGRLDESNIVKGKRRRRRIDYRVLNDSMFGKLSEKDRSKIDDQDDFQYKAPKRDTSSSEDDDESSSSSDDDDASTRSDEIGKQEGATSKESSESDQPMTDKKNSLTKRGEKNGPTKRRSSTKIPPPSNVAKKKRHGN